MNGHRDLINSLSSNLERVKPAVNCDRLALVWLLCSGLYVAAITLALGPLRPNAIFQLTSEPRFLLETLTGAAAIISLSLVAFRAAVPGALSKKFALFSIALLALWLSSYIIGLVNPSLEPSMLGKRHYCVFETFIYALPPVAAAFILTRRLYPLRPVQAAMWYALAAGMIPALYMQLACMYVPSHILQFHIMPGVLVGLMGAGLGLIKR